VLLVVKRRGGQEISESWRCIREFWWRVGQEGERAEKERKPIDNVKGHTPKKLRKSRKTLERTRWDRKKSLRKEFPLGGG